MNLSVQDIGGGILLISQFTLNADTRRGNRPSFQGGLEQNSAKKIYDCLVEKTKIMHTKTEQGIFAAYMNVTVENDGPATFLLEIKS